MELTGRLTANAVISTLKDERQVVNFTIAINDYFKPKGASEAKQATQYVRCSYWKGTAVAQRLLKGTVVEITGRLFTSAYVSGDGEAKATLNVHCNSIKVHSTGGKNKENTNAESKPAFAATEYSANTSATAQEEDDIPF